MNIPRGFFAGIAVTLLTGATGVGAWWIVSARSASQSPAKPAPPAAVTKKLDESSLLTITLTPEAEQRLGVVVKPVQSRDIRRTRVYGGDLAVPVGHTVPVSAPLGGQLHAPPKGVPRAGQRVEKGQTVLLLAPLLTPEARTTLAASRAEAEGQVKSVRAQLDGALIALERARKLFKQEAGSRRQVDEAEAASEVARKNLEAAEARRDTFTRALGEFDKGTGMPLPLTSPLDGVLRQVAVVADQNVPAGAILFEVVQLDPLWVRVPVPVGDLHDIKEGQDTGISDLTARLGEPVRPAHRVPAPPSASSLAGTVDLFYEVANAGDLVPGQRVAARLVLRGSGKQRTVPWAAVVCDIHGGTWVYEQTQPRTYVRRRVEVPFVDGDEAVLTEGPAEGKNVVVEGAEEIFGAETGFGK